MWLIQMLQKISCIILSLLIILFSCFAVSAVEQGEDGTSIVAVDNSSTVDTATNLNALNAKLDYQNMLMTSAFVIACAVAVILILYKFIRQFY